MHPSWSAVGNPPAQARHRWLTGATAPPALDIRLVEGVGTGPTTLAAYDAALRQVGVADYNLIRLSSVIPAGSMLTRSEGPLRPPGRWGDRMYVVTADARTAVAGAAVWAGIGWARDPSSGHGLLVEHEAHTQADVIADIEASLASLRRGRGRAGERLTDGQVMTVGITCAEQPVCALVLAMFSTEPWHPLAA